MTPLGMIFDTRTGQLIYSGFDKEPLYAHYNEDPRNRLFLLHALTYTPEQCEKDPGIYTQVKNTDVKEIIDCGIKIQLLNNLIRIQDGDDIGH